MFGRSFLTVILATFLLTLAIPAQAQEWVLYDDFSSGAIDPAKWSADSGGATTVVDGQVRLECPVGVRKVDLTFTNPAEIAAIRATVTIESAAEDVRAAVNGFIGMLGENPVWFSNELRPIRSDGPSTRYSLDLLTPAPDNAWIGSFVSSSANYPGIVIGQPYVLTFYADLVAPQFSVDGQGSLTRTLATPFTEPTDPWMALRARNYTNSAGEYIGSVTALFDDVYVIYKTTE